MPSDYFPLYHTLKQNINPTRITKKQYTDLASKIASADTHVLTNVILAIYEHARLEEEFDPKNTLEIPLLYGITKVDDNYTLDVTKLPDKLFFIISRLINIPLKST